MVERLLHKKCHLPTVVRIPLGDVYMVIVISTFFENGGRYNLSRYNCLTDVCYKFIGEKYETPSIYAVAIARTKQPLSSARTWTTTPNRKVKATCITDTKFYLLLLNCLSKGTV